MFIDISIVATAGLVVGYILFMIIKSILPQRLKKENQGRRHEMLAEAKRQAEKLKQDYTRSNEDKLQIFQEELNENIESRQATLELLNADLDNSETSLRLEEARLLKIEAKIAKISEKFSLVDHDYQKTLQSSSEVQEKLANALVQKVQEQPDVLLINLRDKLVEERFLESQKRLKFQIESLETTLKKEVERRLGSALARYAPNFAWPKLLGSVEIPNPKVTEKLLQSDNTLMKDLQAMLDMVELELKTDGAPHYIKLAGGFGMHREAARRTLEELLKLDPSAWGRVDIIFKRHLADIEKTAAFLGARASFELGITNMHPEIERLVGALNWRTSYRQNQWMHSLEVAKLAGIVANELDVDPEKAKRCGLLHDIGKALDYKIEGSHAVISGDYADRFGELQEICDTVMSHHNDLVVETPLAHVLKVADTLSGARPGARVNLEAGYQSRLSGIEDAINSFPGVVKIAIMNGGREVHVDVNNRRVSSEALEKLTEQIAAKISSDVAFPGQIKIMVSRKFEAVAQA